LDTLVTCSGVCPAVRRSAGVMGRVVEAWRRPDYAPDHARRVWSMHVRETMEV
jgi:hypothetical protein